MYRLGKSPEEIERKRLDEVARKLIAAEADAVEKLRISTAEKLRKKNLPQAERKAEAAEAKAVKKASSDLKRVEKENKLAAARLRLVDDLPIIIAAPQGNGNNNNADNNESIHDEDEEISSDED